MTFSRIAIGLALVLGIAASTFAEPKQVLLLGQKRDHPPGRHEYVPGLKILEKCLKDVPGLEVKIVAADEPWTKGPELLKRADAVVLYLGEGAKWADAKPERLAALRDLAKRGGGIVSLHWAIGAQSGKYIDRALELWGGCHGGDDRRYIVMDGDVHVIAPNHPIARGVSDLRIHDEFYYRLKFTKQGKITPILQVPIEGNVETVGWTYERPDGGRSFGYSGMDEHRNWANPNYRRLAAQAVLWTLKMPVPEKGLPVEITDEDLKLPPANGK